MKSKREFTEFLDEEIARLGRQRQQLIDLRHLYEPKQEALPEAPAAMAVSTEDMIVRVVENAHLVMSREEIRTQVQQDFGVLPEDFDAVLESRRSNGPPGSNLLGGGALRARSASCCKISR